MEITNTPTDRIINSLDNARRVLLSTSTVLEMQRNDDIADEARTMANSLEHLVSKLNDRRNHR